ncbi:MAG: hypothetical protein E7055_18635 [Lentisphaerae bacterium]|nr:hypothetical protein [Lentisphaerota bacterium]
MRLKIAGHSGCSIEVIRENGQLLLYKYSTNPEYGKRLQKQFEKQQEFRQKSLGKGITAPSVLHRIDSPGKFGMVMEFIHAKTFIDYFENASYTAPNEFADKIIAFLESEFAQSSLQGIPESLLTAKLDSVESNILASEILRNDKEISGLLIRARALIHDGNAREWPVGSCHGDFTLSNILFQDSTLYLIDFLDSFIETPLMDLVKLRQDTRYCWSQFLYQDPFDCVKNRIIMDFLDNRIWYHFKNYPGVSSGYLELQCMNFLRILQYAKSPGIIDFLKKQLIQLLQKEPS